MGCFRGRSLAADFVIGVLPSRRSSMTERRFSWALGYANATVTASLGESETPKCRHQSPIDKREVRNKRKGKRRVEGDHSLCSHLSPGFLFPPPPPPSPRHFCFPLQPQYGLVSSPFNLNLQASLRQAPVTLAAFFIQLIKTLPSVLKFYVRGSLLPSVDLVIESSGGDCSF